MFDSINKTFTLAIAPIFIISISILCQFAMAICCVCYTGLLSHQKEVHSSIWGDRYTPLAAHLSKRLTPLPATILCLGNASKKQDCKITALSMVLLVQIFGTTTDGLETTQTMNWTVLWCLSSYQEALYNFNSFWVSTNVSGIFFSRLTISQYQYLLVSGTTLSFI